MGTNIGLPQKVHWKMRFIPISTVAVEKLKQQARKTKQKLKITHAEALDRVARGAGYNHWSHLTQCAAETLRQQISKLSLKVAEASDDSNNGFYVLFFDRQTILQGELDKVVRDLSLFTCHKAMIEKFAGTMTFVFEGWENDPREMWEIAEPLDWFARLTERFPYWLVLLERRGDSILNMLHLLMRSGYRERTTARGSVIAYDGDEFRSLMGYLFEGMNTLCEQHGIGQETNDRWTREIKACLKARTNLDLP